MTKTEAMSLVEVLPKLGEAYIGWKELEAVKNIHKEEFFALATEKVVIQGLAVRLCAYPASDEDAARARAELHNPGWTVIESRAHSEQPGTYEVILEEDPALKPFEEVVEGVKYARQVSKGSVMVDDEWLQEENPGLYLEVMYELPWGAQMMRPLDQLGAETLSALSKFIYNARPKVQLAPPRAIGGNE